jgi:hypothetical protein
MDNEWVQPRGHVLRPRGFSFAFTAVWVNAIEWLADKKIAMSTCNPAEMAYCMVTDEKGIRL